MTTEVQIKAFSVKEWPVYRELRLRALDDSPDAFGRTYAAERLRPPEEWAARVEAAQDRSHDLPLVALCNGQAVGLAWGRVPEHHPQTAHITQVWVAPSHRRRGIARLLMEELIGWAAGSTARSIELFVTQGNDAAERLYRGLGFRPFGAPEPLREGSAILMQGLRLPLPPRVNPANATGGRRSHPGGPDRGEE